MRIPVFQVGEIVVDDGIAVEGLRKRPDCRLDRGDVDRGLGEKETYVALVHLVIADEFAGDELGDRDGLYGQSGPLP